MEHRSKKGADVPGNGGTPRWVFMILVGLVLGCYGFTWAVDRRVTLVSERVATTVAIREAIQADMRRIDLKLDRVIEKTESIDKTLARHEAATMKP